MMGFAIIVLILIIILMCFEIRGLYSKIDFEQYRVSKLENELKKLQEKHPICDTCHGEGLTIVGHEITEFGVIWQHDETKCEKCNGRGDL